MNSKSEPKHLVTPFSKIYTILATINLVDQESGQDKVGVSNLQSRQRHLELLQITFSCQYFNRKTAQAPSQYNDVLSSQLQILLKNINQRNGICGKKYICVEYQVDNICLTHEEFKGFGPYKAHSSKPTKQLHFVNLWHKDFFNMLAITLKRKTTIKKI